MEWISNSSSRGKGLQPTLLCCQRQGCVLGSGRKKTAYTQTHKMSWDAIDSQTNACKKFQHGKYHINSYYISISSDQFKFDMSLSLSCNYHMVDSWYGFGPVPCSLPCFPILFNWNTSYEYYKLEHRFQWHKFGSKWELHIRDWQVQAFNYACSTSSM